MKRTKWFGIAFVLVVMMLGLVGCSAQSVAGTYTVSLTTEELSGNLSHTGYLVSAEAVEENTLVLNEDATYSYTKLVTTASGIKLEYIFTGSYTNNDATVTLSVPSDCTFSENWAQFLEYGFQNSEGKYSEGAVVQCKADESHEPLNMFTTPYLLDSGTTGEVTVSLDANNGTFTYNVATSSDDE